MARCDYYGTIILFGGAVDGDLRFCNETCQANGMVLSVAHQLPEGAVAEHLRSVHEGECPSCNGPGPVDIHTTHRIWSMLVMTSWQNSPRMCCRSCGIKAQLGGLFSCLVLGWWGFPWGLIMTPVQVIRNLSGIIAGPDPSRPSAQLERAVRVQLAAHLLAQGQSGE
jgi:hypothetical protein